MVAKHPALLRVISGIAAVPILAVSVLGVLWAVFCFLGGPEGNRGSRESIVWGSLVLAFAIAVAAVGILLARVAFSSKQQSRPMNTFAAPGSGNRKNHPWLAFICACVVFGVLMALREEMRSIWLRSAITGCAFASFVIALLYIRKPKPNQAPKSTAVTPPADAGDSASGTRGSPWRSA